MSFHWIVLYVIQLTQRYHNPSMAQYMSLPPFPALIPEEKFARTVIKIYCAKRKCFL